MTNTRAFSALAETLARIRESGSAWTGLPGAAADGVTTPEDLARLPVLRKSDLLAKQSQTPPFGGLNLTAPGGMARLFSSPGPIYEPEGAGDDWFGAADALRALGVRPGMIVLNTFSYHMTPAGFMFDSGARSLGCAVIPAGPSAGDDQIAAIGQYRPEVYIGIPDFLNILLGKLDAAGIANPIRLALVSGAALTPSLLAGFEARGIKVRQAYGTAELGIVAYEDDTGQGMRVSDRIILEITRPGTGDPVPHGEVGEVLITRPDPDYPLIRFATGDLSALLPGDAPRIAGWKGRADQAAKVKGMFVRPEQVEAMRKDVPGAGRMRLVITRENERDGMVLYIEHPDPTPPEGIEDRLAERLRIRGTVRIVAPDSLPNDGKVISDERRPPP